MKLDSIYKILDKKDFLNENSEFTDLEQRYNFIKEKGDIPLTKNKFKTKEDFIKLCPTGTEFYIFEDDNESVNIGFIKEHNNKFGCTKYIEENSGLEYIIGYDGFLNYIKDGTYIPICHIDKNYDGDDSEIDD